MMQDKQSTEPNRDGAATSGGAKKLRWSLVSLAIAGLTIWAVTSQWKNYSFREFLDFVSRADLR